MNNDPLQIRSAVIAHLQLEGLAEYEQNEILRELQSNILERINIALFEMLSPEDRLTLAKIEGENPESTIAFLGQKIPNLPLLLEALALSVVKDFQKRMAEGAENN